VPGARLGGDDIRAELEDGSGLLLLRGIEPERYTPADRKMVYAGLCRKPGTLVYSNRGGERMREIRDVGADVGRRYGPIDGFLSRRRRSAERGF